MLPAVEIDEGHAIHYSAVPRGTRVYSSDGTEIGRVDEVIDNYREHILDGFVIETTRGKLVFADAPEVARTAEKAVTLTVDAAAAAELPTPEKAAPNYRPRRTGRVGRMLGGGWKKG